MDLSDADRFPLLTDRSRQMLTRLREHPAAPHWRHVCGERLTANGLARVQRYGEQTRSRRPGWQHGEPPSWVHDFLDRCREDVPFYRYRLPANAAFESLPTTTREDLRTQYWLFVPEPADLDELVTYWTSGTSGARVMIPCNPEAPAKYLPLLELALASRGVRILGGHRMSIAQTACQSRTYTFPSVMSYCDGAGYAKLNLHAAEWRDPGDRATYLNVFPPEVVTGDPVGLMELATLPLHEAPKAIVSAATALLAGTRAHLEATFGCPVLNLYSMIEVGPIACDTGSGFEILPPDLYVEILAPDGAPCPPGTRGEVTVTGGINAYLPLVRYRTGDHASLDFSGPVPRLRDFEGRSPVIFTAATGARFNSIDVSTALAEFPLPRLALHQRADRSVHLRTRCDESLAEQVREKLRDLFAGVEIEIERLPKDVPWAGKTIHYRSDV